MALPTPTQLAAASSALVPAAQQQVKILGFDISAADAESVITVAVDALCMRAWKAAHAAGQAASDAITTEADAETSQRKP